MVTRQPKRIGFRIVAISTGLVCGVALFGLWVGRKPIAAYFIDAELKKRGVAAHYDLTQLDPYHQRLTHVMVGDPANPDLTADWVESETRVGLFGASLSGIRASGVRVRGVLDKAGNLHFGALDKFRSGGTAAFALPDLTLDLADAQLALATPYGGVHVQMEGKGNLARDFAGSLAAQTAEVTAGSCVVSPLNTSLTFHIDNGRPVFEGPIRATTLTCSGTTLTKPVSTAHVQFSADLKAAAGNFTLAADRIASPDLTMAAQSLRVAEATPLAPFGRQIVKSILALSGGATLSGRFSTDPAQGTIFTSASVRSASGAVVTSANGGSVTISPAGKLSFGGRVTIAGGGFPTTDVSISGTPGAYAGAVSSLPLTAQNMRLALAPVHFSHDARGTKISTLVGFDGPLVGGTVRGLMVPIVGLVGANGSFALANPCVPVTFSAFTLTTLALGKTATNVCVRGQDVSLTAPHLAGRYRGETVDATAAALHYTLSSKTLSLNQITGRYGPTRLSAAHADYRLGTQSFTAAMLKAEVGEAGHDSKLAVDDVSGSIKDGKLSGIYTNAAGALPNVPLALDHSSGTWRFADSALTVNGALRISDTDPAKRFEPLIAPDVELHFGNGIITATGTLHEPKSGAFVSRVTINHTLTSATGAANIDIQQLPLLTFGKALQPEALTRITLGVIANLKGSISGEGRIRWTPKGVTSDGDFETNHLDLAAAFGPVSGLHGKIHFTDLLGLVSAPNQIARMTSVNPGIVVDNGEIHYQLLPGNRVAIEGGTFPFADGWLILEPTVMDLSESATRRLTFTVKGVDAAKFILQSGFEDVAATGVFDGILPLVFDSHGGRIEGGALAVREAGGNVSYVGPVSTASLGRFGKIAFDALKSIKYRGLKVALNGPLDGEMVTLVTLSGTNQVPLSAKKSYLLKQVTGIPFKFNIRISAPFRSLFNTAKNLQDPSELVQQDLPTKLKASAPRPALPPAPPVHPPATPIQP